MRPHGRACSLVGVDRVGLAQAAPFSSFGSDHLHDVETLVDGGSGEAGSVGGCAFDPDRDGLAVAEDERHSSAIASWRRGELAVIEVATTLGVDHGNVNGVL